MRAALAPGRVGALALALTLAIGGCGAASPDLFEVVRTGHDRNANVTMVVSDGGTVTCNGVRHPLDSDRLLRARALMRSLEPQARLNLSLPPGPNAELSYKERQEAGSVAFSDTSRGNPQSFLLLAAYTKDVTERVCGIQH
jgi:hypothetical protein